MQIAIIIDREKKLQFVYNTITCLLMKKWLIGITFIGVVSFACHFAFSSLGYNPSDDGFILAGAKRILFGEIPHRDFITIRPFLPYLLWAPVVAISGDSVYWVSRFLVWIQFATIAWMSVLIAEKILKKSFSFFEQISFALFAFLLPAHNFPLMAWYSIDAVFLSIIGIWFALCTNTKGKLLGYFLIGTTALARQNFLLLGPFVLFIIGDYKQLKYWVATLSPLFAMGIFLLIVGALHDALLQMTAHTELVTYGFL